jgi:hypothetical protein
VEFVRQDLKGRRLSDSVLAYKSKHLLHPRLKQAMELQTIPTIRMRRFFGQSTGGNKGHIRCKGFQQSQYLPESHGYILYSIY